MGPGHLRKGIAIDDIELAAFPVALGQPAIVIAADNRTIQRHQPIGGTRRIDGAADMIAEAQSGVDALPGNVGQHGIERHGIAMHVGNDGDLQISSSWT